MLPFNRILEMVSVKKGVNMVKKAGFIFVIIALLILPTGSASGKGSAIWSDPGAGSLQDEVIQQTQNYTVPPSGLTDFSSVDLDSKIKNSCLDVLTRQSGNYGHLSFTGFYDALIKNFSNSEISFIGPIPIRATSGLPPASPQCESYITPGEITLVATKDAPSNPVVVNQDPNRGGVDLTWKVNILPTVYTYGVWQNVPYPNNGNCKSLNSECLINQSGQPCCTGYFCDPDNPNSGNGHCRVDPNYPPLWDCVDSSILFREDIVSITPKASLTAGSRSWILGSLSQAYPGTTLQHPDWSFRVTKSCKWDHNVCTWSHTEPHVPIVDPGVYDLMVQGVTLGTDITPSRVFTVISGSFGVWLVETTKTG
jgi:hypothetical protein